jgi:hypothetical protein
MMKFIMAVTLMVSCSGMPFQASDIQARVQQQLDATKKSEEEGKKKTVQLAAHEAEVSSKTGGNDTERLLQTSGKLRFPIFV